MCYYTYIVRTRNTLRVCTWREAYIFSTCYKGKCWLGIVQLCTVKASLRWHNCFVIKTHMFNVAHAQSTRTMHRAHILCIEHMHYACATSTLNINTPLCNIIYSILLCIYYIVTRTACTYIVHMARGLAVITHSRLVWLIDQVLGLIQLNFRINMCRKLFIAITSPGKLFVIVSFHKT